MSFASAPQPPSSAAEARRGRNPRWYTGWIVADGGAHAIRCLVVDVTRAGARLKLFAPAHIPDEFTLHFTRTGTAHIRCCVCWRRYGEVVVEFVSDSGTSAHFEENAAVRAAIAATSQAAGARTAAARRPYG